MKILFVGKNHAQGLKDSDSTSFSSVAISQGHLLCQTLNDLPEVVICVDFEKSVLSTLRAAKMLSIPTVLIASEPSVVIPEHSKTSVLRKFDRVIEVGRPSSLPVYKWPQTWNSLDSKLPRKDRSVVVNADKWSFVRGQLYWLRAAVVSASASTDVYGHGWARSKAVRFAHRGYEFIRVILSLTLPSLEGLRFSLASPLSYMGDAGDKIQVTSQYKVALVIENSEELITEKLFDAWFAGCVPVYVGPDVKPFGLPSSLLIRCEDPTVTEVEARIAEALQIDFAAFSKELQLFLQGSEAREWDAPIAIQFILDSALGTGRRKGL